MRSIAEWADWASVLSSPMELTSSASFSPSIRISLRLKIHQAQAKNFCRVLDIRVPEIMHSNDFQVIPLEKFLKVTSNIIWLEQRSHVIDKHESQIVCII